MTHKQTQNKHNQKYQIPVAFTYLYISVQNVFPNFSHLTEHETSSSFLFCYTMQVKKTVKFIVAWKKK